MGLPPQIRSRMRAVDFMLGNGHAIQENCIDGYE